MLTSKDYLKLRISKMKNILDLLDVLNIAKRRIYGKTSKPIALNALLYYGNTIKRRNCFKTFNIKKKSGGFRQIVAPVTGFKVILKCLNYVLNEISVFDSSVNGFVKERSIVTNAHSHLNSNFLLNIDLKDFFDSIDQNRIKLCFMYGPLNLNESKENIAYFLSLLCSMRKPIDGISKYVLPQGSPVSPILSNIACEKLDRRLKGLAKRFNLRYSRYADDITFSALHDFKNNTEFYMELDRIIVSQNFQINTNKSRYQSKDTRQEVTGLIVNDKINVKREYIKSLRMYLHFWERYGLEKAQNLYFRDLKEKQAKAIPTSVDFIRCLDGKLNFLKMVKGEGNKQYLKLQNRFNKLAPAKVEETKTKLGKAKQILKNNLPYKHEANKLPRILEIFSLENNPLKYITHSWEPGRFASINSFHKQISYEWDLIKQDIIKVNPRLYAKISNFIFNSDLGKMDKNNQIISWGINNLKFGWSSEDLLNAEFENNLNPFEFIIPSKITAQESVKDIYLFRDYVEIFKNEIEIREENNGLKNIIYELWELVLGYDFILDVKNIDGISFYTDVQWLHHGLKLIFSQLRKRSQFPRVKIDFFVDHYKGTIEMRILQVNSRCKRNIDDKKIRQLNSGDFSSISEAFKNICDWSIEAQFSDDNFYKINYLTSDYGVVNVEAIEEVEGFTHVLKFYL